ncbi:MAG: flagellar basal body-associated FliL family protein [Desulfobacterales bacterium]|nr:flagellar basal body-associated FliL family protein [Desulfobacterales bacterium]
MAEDLLEEIERDGTDPSDSDGASDTKPGKLAAIRNLVAGKKKLIIICLAALVGLTIIVGGLVMFLAGDDEADKSLEATAPQVTEESIQAALEKKDEAIFEDVVVLEPFERIRLKSGSAMGLISMNVSLELTDPRFRRQIYTMQDRIHKIIESQVREMTWLELRSPEGKIKLKYELLKRMNSIFPKVTIRNVYFTNFIMQ